MERNEIPLQSAQKTPSKLIKAAKQSSMIERLQEKDRDFHHFIESSRILVEEEPRREPTDQGVETKPAPVNQFNMFSSNAYQ